MQRAVKVSLSEATATKLRRLDALRREVRSCTQAYVDSLWITKGRLDKATLNRVPGGSLSYRHRSNCLKVALETIIATRKAAKVLGKMVQKPRVSGAIRLSSLVAQIAPGRGTFNYVLKVSGLTKGKPIVVPFKGHKRLNYWLGKPGAKLLQGCILGGTCALWLQLPDETPKPGKALGIDLGVNKLIVDSDGTQYGTGIKAVCQRVRRTKPKSKGRLRASRARKDYINKTVKELPWDRIGVLGIEDLRGLKKGKSPTRSKGFRKAMAPWTVRQAVARLTCLAQENRVRLVAVNPKNTSRMCPACRTVSKDSRRGELFDCVRCHYSADADHVGAINILARAIGAPLTNSQQSMVAGLPHGESHYDTVS
mgnify:CR=1 FL=1